MLQQTLMFLASDSPPARATTRPEVTHAVFVSPPAKKLPGRITLALNVVGNAVGFAGLMASLWFSLWLMQALVPVTAL